MINPDINMKENTSPNRNKINNNMNSNVNNFGNNFVNQEEGNNNINLGNNNITNQNNNNKMINRSFDEVRPLNSNINVKLLTKQSKCTCSKTGCIKKYCACFALGKPCEDCDCKNCQNKPINGNNNNNLDQNITNYGNNQITNDIKIQIIICNCAKSNCMKKYCEWFKQGFSCNSLCRCLECSNKNNINNFRNDNNNFIKYEKPDNNLINENNINNNNISDTHGFSTSYNKQDTFGKSIDYNNPLNFQTEAFGIYIKKEKLKIDMRKINLNSIYANNHYNYNITKEVELTTIKDFNQTPKFSNKKRAREKNDISNMRTCSNTKSSKRNVRGVPSVNKKKKKKKLQLN